MKIITEDYNNNFYCYIQVRDIYYLLKTKPNITIKAMYEKCLRTNKTDYEFIRITDPHIIELILHTEGIIDFETYHQENPELLTRYLINSIFSDTEETKHKCESIRDILAFQKGELNYKIPIVPTREYACFDSKRNISIQTSNMKGYYILKTEDDIPIDNKDYQFFLGEQISYICSMNGIKKEELDIKTQTIGSYIIIKIGKKQPKKQNIFQRLLKKQSK